MADKKETTKKTKTSKKQENGWKSVIELKKQLYLTKQSIATGEEKDTSLVKKKKQEIARLLTELNGKK